MRTADLVLLLALTCILAGCDGATPPVIPGAKNNGQIVPLPDTQGYVEVRVDTAGGRGKNIPRTIVAYFYGSDGATPLSPAPTDVTLKIGDATSVPLTPHPTDGSFSTKPGDFPDGFRATIAAKVGGRTIEAVIPVR
jgi:hypothetical protein